MDFEPRRGQREPCLSTFYARAIRCHWLDLRNLAECREPVPPRVQPSERACQSDRSNRWRLRRTPIRVDGTSAKLICFRSAAHLDFRVPGAWRILLRPAMASFAGVAIHRFALRSSRRPWLAIWLRI